MAGITSFREGSQRAGSIFLVSCIALLCISVLPDRLISENEIFRIIFLSVGLFLPGIFLLPLSGIHKKDTQIPQKRYNESDAVLSRRLLEPGTEAYAAYYRDHSGYKESDNRARGNPGLLSENSRYFDPITFNAARANFSITEHLHRLDVLKPARKSIQADSKKQTSFIKDWMKRTGARSIGITELKDYHLYSHKGRGPKSGLPIANDLPHAIAITVEMDHKMMSYAPAGPTVMESSEQYLFSGILASKLALYIQNLGYRAKAHTDGNYEVICPLVARDAGLGEIGRMGLLLTPSLGPRVRIAVVTTDMPLDYEEKKSVAAVVEFCTLCRKCAINCPVKAIPEGPMKMTGGVSRWKINSDKCYHYWTVSGTDCGRCVIHCPYSHPDNWLHRLIRFGIKNNLLFRRMAVKLDDVFYRKIPPIKKLPEELTYRKNR